MTSLLPLLLFVALLVGAFLIESIRAWHQFRLHDRAVGRVLHTVAALPGHHILGARTQEELDQRIARLFPEVN